MSNLDHLFSQHVQRQSALEATARVHRFNLAWSMYYGEHPDALVVKSGRRDPNVKPNYSRLIVDKSTSFLFGEDDLQLEILTDGETKRGKAKRSPAEEWLEEVLEHNDKMVLFNRLGTNGGVCGHAFLKIQMTDGEELPELQVLDPGTVQVECDPRNLRRVNKYVIEFSGIDEHGRARDYKQTITRDGKAWRIKDEDKSPDGSHWTERPEPHWPYKFPPIVDAQNLPDPNMYWGIADLENDKINLNRAINFLASNISKIIEIHGHPKTWTNHMNSNLKINLDPEGVIQIPGAGELHNLEMISNVDSQVNYLRWVLEALHETSRIPEVATGKVDNIGQLSGLALGILYGPIRELTGTKRLTYGGLIRRLCAYLLEIGGHGDGHKIKIHWPDVTPSDPMAQIAALQAEQMLGVVSRETIAGELGRDWEEEREKIEGEQEMIPNPLTDLEDDAGDDEEDE
ncbi:MAG: phage portal protein [Chloroflexota bacterium]|nr:phage portal protein [Chloroflexota bacterium]